MRRSSHRPSVIYWRLSDFWSQSKLLFSIRQIFYQMVHFCRLTCDTNWKNFLKGSGLRVYFFLRSWFFRENSWNSGCCYGYDSRKALFFTATKVIHPMYNTQYAYDLSCALVRKLHLKFSNFLVSTKYIFICFAHKNVKKRLQKYDTLEKLY